MNSRRGTPSGEGRGRSRDTGRRGTDPRGGARDEFRGRSAAGGGRARRDRGDDSRGRSSRREFGSGSRPSAKGDGRFRREDRYGDKGRYGSRSDQGRGGAFRDDDRKSFRGDRTSRDAVRTLGASDTKGGYRGRFGRDRSEANAASRPWTREDRADRADRGARADREENPFKTSRQPLRDPDFYDPDYTDERDTTEVPDGERLQKVLARAGVASRRACEEMIGAGRVMVDGQVVRRFGARVDPTKQVIHVDGRRVPTMPDLVYYALNKPIGVVSTMDDPEGRPCLNDYVQDLAPRLFHVGRLDTETEGLLLFTNDGELAHRLTHPSYGVRKKYWAKVPGPVPRRLRRVLREGVELEDGLARADNFRVVQEHGQQALVEIVLHEGRKHIVRRMMEAVGHRVIDLARIEFGPVKLGRLKPGTVRALTLQEVGELYSAVGM